MPRPAVIQFTDIRPSVAIIPPSVNEVPIGISILDAERFALDAPGIGSDFQFVTAATAGGAGMDNPVWPEVDAERIAWSVQLASITPGSEGTVTHVLVDTSSGDFLGTWTTTIAVPAWPAPGPDLPTALGLVRVQPAGRSAAPMGALDNGLALVGGWMLGADSLACPAGTFDPVEFAWNACAGVWLHPTADGGAPWTFALGALAPGVASLPPLGEAVPVVLLTHPGDPASPNDRPMGLVDEIVWKGTPVSTRTLGEAPAGVSLAAADKAAQPYLADMKTNTLLYGVRVPLWMYTTLTGGVVSGPGYTQDSWVWMLVYTNGPEPASPAQMALVGLGTGKPLVSVSTFP